MKVIGIMTNKRFDDGAPMGNIEIDYLFDHYSKAIIKNGATPIMLPPTTDEKVIDKYLDIVDGIIAAGGIDVTPTNYNQLPGKFIDKINPSLDEAQIKIVKKAYEKKVPLLGICRGHQLINVALGGTLFQDNSLFSSEFKHDVWSQPNYEQHNINIEDNSFLYEAYNSNKAYVNSFHHQSVDKVGEGLKIIAKSDDGFIEATEGDNVYTVQYHPEMLVAYASEENIHFNVFKTFITKL